MRYRFSVQELGDRLWDMGMDEDMERAGYLWPELEARDGQECVELAFRGVGTDAVSLVRWDDGVEEEIPAHGLVEVTPA